MNVRVFLAIKAILATATGLVFLLIPGIAISLYGTSLNDQGLFFARLFSVMAIGIGGICWFARTMTIEARKAIILSLFIADSLALVVTVMAQLQGMVNYLGWINVGIWAFLACGLGYFRFISKA